MLDKKHKHQGQMFPLFSGEDEGEFTEQQFEFTRTRLKNNIF